MVKGNPIQVLLVEDDAAHAEAVLRNLAEFRVANPITLVRDGQEALDYLWHRNGYSSPAEAPRPDMILLDLRLPKVDGLEVLRRLKADDDLRSIPVVVLTTSTAEADMVRAYDEGVSSYLVKPVDFIKFTQMMNAFGYYWLAWNQFPHARVEAHA